jgi:hypothetical protein
MKLTIAKIAHHRNGVTGAPFFVVLFHDADGSKVGIIFEQEAHCAVLDVAKLAAGDIAFGSNSWRGDQFEPHLRKAMKAYLQESVESLRNRRHEETVKPLAQPELDFRALLAERKQIAAIWGVEDVREVRPDLTDDQAWEVLQTAESQHDATVGITWDTLDLIADELFPRPENEQEGRP